MRQGQAFTGKALMKPPRLITRNLSNQSSSGAAR
jgi:hypothetical protein